MGCRAVRKPAAFSGSGVLTVYTVDLAKGLPTVDADAVFTSGDTVYASPSSLFVASQRWDGGAIGARTSIHRFDTSDPDRTAYASSGAVPGSLLNQFSLSEDKGVLRVARRWAGARRPRAGSPRSARAAGTCSHVARSAGSGAGSRSTRCASSATPATW